MTDVWTESTLGDVVDITIGRTPPRGQARYWTDDLNRPFCTIADMKGQLIDPAQEGVTELAEVEGRAKRVPAGSLLMSFKLTIGRLGFAARDLFPNEAIAWLRPMTDDVTAEYLMLFLSTQNLTRGSGRAVKGDTLNASSLRAIPVRFPSRPEQRRIVDLIRSLDAQVHALQDEARCTRHVLSAVRRSEMERLDRPRSLESVMVTIRSGGTPSRQNSGLYGGHVPWLKSGEVNGSWVAETEETITDEALALSSAWLVPAGSVVVAMYGATAAQVGYLATPMATNQAVLALVPDEKECNGRFAYHWFCEQATDLKRAASGAAQPNLSKAVILREVSFPALHVSVQSHIAQRLDTIDHHASSLEAEAIALRDYRDRLLAALVSSQTSIPKSYDTHFPEVA